ncbi:MAG TPA: UvrD-helicase domain-containing protein [Erysipelotrichaceae bacterium]|nr:UvrD-helicase domain-containing protein [Erysipelotrichaceae bacterium]
MSFLTNLNENQSKAVMSNSPYLRIIAGAGSGKTRVLISRIAHLIHDLGIHPGSILAITFTNKAANEMKERLDRMLSAYAAGVHISTIHSLCVMILRHDCTSMDLPRNFTVLDSDDQKSIIKEAYREIGLDKQKYSIPSMLDYIGANKGAEVTVDHAFTLAGAHYGEQEKAKVYQYYVERQKALFALDFDDLLLVTVKMFGMFPDILAKWQRRFNFIHVDEFQDIDRVQYKLIKQLAGRENQVYVVGDPDQTIYTWRGADVNIIMEFEKDFKPSETIILNQNYRSTQHILNGANSLIKNNQYRVDKDLFTELKSDEKVTHCAFISEDHEANWIADKLKEMNEKGKLYKDMAILYRSNYLSRSLEKAFLDHHIPYVIYGGTRFYDRAEIKDMLSYLRMLTHGDDLAFMRVINTPKRGLGTKTLDKLRDDAKANKRTMYEQIKAENNFSGKTYDAFDRFIRLVESTKTMMGQKPLIEILEKMENDSGLRAMYEAAHEVDRLENIKELINDVITFQNQYPESGLDEYLQMVALYGDRNDLTDGDYCQMMTIHAAKGLEFDTVFVIGLSEGIFPNERAMSEGRRGLEEERRLAYVAYTRAKNKLFLTEVSGYSFVLTKIRSRSRFIEEVDQKHIDHIGVNYDFEKPKEMNIKSKPKEQSLFADSMEKRKALPYKKGELILHSTFGEGVIMKIDGGMAEIAFDYPHGVKKIMLAAPAISKVKREEV